MAQKSYQHQKEKNVEMDIFFIEKVEKGKMSEKEEAEFWYHLGECKDCARVFSGWIKDRAAKAAIEKAPHQRQ